MSSLRDRSNRIRPKSRGRVTAFFGILSLLVLAIAAPQANATAPQATVGMYLDQPFVQGSYVAEDFPSETSVTTFNDQSYNNPCSFNGATLEPLYSASADCRIQTQINYGAAGSTTSTPSPGYFPESLSYGQVGSGGASIAFSTPQTYFGMWWSAGSVGNEVQILNGSSVIASTSANDVAGILSSSTSLTSQAGDTYATRYYIGNPVDWLATGSPYNFADQDVDNTYHYQSVYTSAQEPFVYIHFIAEDGVTFDRVNLIAPGNGFEFDNFTTSIATGIRAAGIPSRLVLQKQLYEATYVDFDANGGTGSLPRQYSLDNAQADLRWFCLDPYTDPTRCISPPNNSYGTQGLGWNTASDGSGDEYYFENWLQFPFTESTTLYAQWQTNFQYSYLTYSGTNFSEDVTGETVWGYVDEYSYSNSSVRNFADITLPSPQRPNQYLEGWYTFDTTNYTIVRAGSPGDVVASSTYTLWDMNLFGHWVENPPPTVDAVAPQLLLVYPRATSVGLPSMPLTGDTSAAICIVESDSSGNEVSGNLQFTDLGTSTSGHSSGYTISAASPLVANASRYVRVTVSISSDTSCTSGYTHVVEIKPLGAKLTAVLPLYLTAR